MLNKDFFMIGKLNEIYGKFLSKKQRKYVDYYFNENYSIDEIGHLENVSKQSVYDVLKRAIRKLESYEKEFKLVAIRALLLELKDDEKYGKKVEEFLKNA